MKRKLGVDEEKHNACSGNQKPFGYENQYGRNPNEIEKSDDAGWVQKLQTIHIYVDICAREMERKRRLKVLRYPCVSMLREDRRRLNARVASRLYISNDGLLAAVRRVSVRALVWRSASIVCTLIIILRT